MRMLDKDTGAVAGSLLTYLGAVAADVHPLLMALTAIFAIVFTGVKILNGIMEYKLKKKEFKK